jgi:hypothetical protein
MRAVKGHGTVMIDDEPCVIRRARTRMKGIESWNETNRNNSVVRKILMKFRFLMLDSVPIRFATESALVTEDELN